MTVLVDTGVLYADHDTDASRHETASEALEAVYDGEFDLPYVSDYVYDEAVTLTLERGRSHEAATRLGDRLRGIDPYPQVYELLRVSAAVFTDAIEVFERFDTREIARGCPRGIDGAVDQIQFLFASESIDEVLYAGHFARP